jgi:hypothetical protein
MNEETIRQSEELFKQISFLGKLKEMAALYGCDISGPATNAHEAVQWVYFGYLAANKEQNGAAMSLGRVGTFLDIYLERDLKSKLIKSICSRILSSRPQVDFFASIIENSQTDLNLVDCYFWDDYITDLCENLYFID